jgi:hypothetical protein
MDTVKEVQEVTPIDNINLTLVSLQSQLRDWLENNQDQPEMVGLDAIYYVISLFQAWQGTGMALPFEEFVDEQVKE